MQSFKKRVWGSSCLVAFLAVGCAHSAGTEGSAAVAEAAKPAAKSQLTKEQKVKRFMELCGAEQTGRQVLEAMSDQFAKMPGLPPGFIPKFRELAAQHSFIDTYAPVYVKHLTDEDLDVLITFYESPTGQRFVQAQPVMMQEAMAIGEQLGRDLAMKALKALEEDRAKAMKTAEEGK